MEHSQFSALFSNNGLAVVKPTATWVSVDPVLPVGTICIDRKDANRYRIKIADGITAWSSLSTIINSDIELKTHTSVLSAGQDTIYVPYQLTTDMNMLVFVGGSKYPEEDITLVDDFTLKLNTPIPNTTVVEILVFKVNKNAFTFGYGYNYIIDGNFDFWYEGTTQTTSGYGSDTMWSNINVGNTRTHTRQPFSIGELFPDGVPTPKYFSRTTITAGATSTSYNAKVHYVEDVTKLAGKTVTLSFYAKADSTKNICIELNQYFGTGGTPSATVISISPTTIVLSTGWKKYTVVVDVPSVTGKILGTNGNDYTGIIFWYSAGTDYSARTNSLPLQSGTFDLAKISLVEGTPETLPVDRPKWKELLLVSRYFQQYGNVNDVVNALMFGVGVVYSANQFTINLRLLTPMRAINPAVSVNSLNNFIAHPLGVCTMLQQNNCSDARYGSIELIGTGPVTAYTGTPSLIYSNHTSNARLNIDCRF